MQKPKYELELHQTPKRDLTSWKHDTTTTKVVVLYIIIHLRYPRHLFLTSCDGTSPSTGTAFWPAFNKQNAESANIHQHQVWWKFRLHKTTECENVCTNFISFPSRLTFMLICKNSDFMFKGIEISPLFAQLYILPVLNCVNSISWNQGMETHYPTTLP